MGCIYVIYILQHHKPRCFKCLSTHVYDMSVVKETNLKTHKYIYTSKCAIRIRFFPIL